MMLERVDVALNRHKDIDLAGAIVVEALPAHGLAAAIVGGFLVETLGLDHVAGFSSEHFPPVAMVWHGKPRSPLRAYAREGDGDMPPLVVVMSEFTPPPRLFRPIARAISGFAAGIEADRIICPDGFPTSRDEYVAADAHVAGAGSTEEARAALKAAGVPLLEHGLLSGVSGMLLEVAGDKQRVEHLVVELGATDEDRLHDVRAVVALADPMAKLLAPLEVDFDPLEVEAQRVDAALRDMRRHVMTQTRFDEDVSNAYR